MRLFIFYLFIILSVNTFANQIFFIKENNLYTKIQSGDSYSKIAQKISVPYHELVKLNKNKKLYKNNIILLPNYFYYRIQKGDHFQKIVKKFNLKQKKNSNKKWQDFFSFYKNKKLFYNKKIKIPISFLFVNQKKNLEKTISKKNITQKITPQKTKKQKNKKKNIEKINVVKTGEERLLKIIEELKQKNRRNENLNKNLNQNSKQKSTTQATKKNINSLSNSNSKVVDFISKNFSAPIKNYKSSLIIKRYTNDYNHNGVTLKNPRKNIYSIADGEVVAVNFFRGLKKTMIIRHQENIFSVYGNLDKTFTAHTKIKKGQKIASGKVFYFSLFKDKFVDPLKNISF